MCHSIKLFNQKETAKQLGWSPNTLRTRTENGEVQCFIGGGKKPRYTQEMIDNARKTFNRTAESSDKDPPRQRDWAPRLVNPQFTKIDADAIYRDGITRGRAASYFRSLFDNVNKDEKLAGWLSNSRRIELRFKTWAANGVCPAVKNGDGHWVFHKTTLNEIAQAVIKSYCPPKLKEPKADTTPSPEWIAAFREEIKKEIQADYMSKFEALQKSVIDNLNQYEIISGEHYKERTSLTERVQFLERLLNVKPKPESPDTLLP